MRFIGNKKLTVKNIMSINIWDYKKVSIDKLKYENPSKIKGGSFMSLINYNDKPLYIQTPRLINKKGIIKHDNRCHLELEFDKSHAQFYDFISNIDDKNINEIQNKSNMWFSKTFSLDMVEEFYKTPIKLGRKNNPPIFKVKIPLNKGNVACTIFNKNNNIMSFNDVKIGSKIVCLLKFKGLRFLKQQIICEWIPIQLQD